ncbi:MAG: hypothetical protein SGPRY_006962 [Prymnesium sp.]
MSRRFLLLSVAVAGLSAGLYYCSKHVGLPGAPGHASPFSLASLALDPPLVASRTDAFACEKLFLRFRTVHLTSILAPSDSYWKARLPASIEPLDVSDTSTLKKVLFGGEPWLIQCYSGLPYAGQHLPAPFRLHEVFTQSLQQMRGVVRAGVIDCEKQLPSNKSIVTKFGLLRRPQPLLIFAAGGDKPKQLPSSAIGSAYAVTAWVKPKAEPKVRVVNSQKSMIAYCGGRRTCLLSRLPHDSPILEQLARNFRTVEVVSAEEGKASLQWGRGAEVGETLEEEEQKHFGASVTLIRPDPSAPPTRKLSHSSDNHLADTPEPFCCDHRVLVSSQGSKPAPRILRGFSGEQDYPSIARFLTKGLEADPEDADQVDGHRTTGGLPLAEINEGRRFAFGLGLGLIWRGLTHYQVRSQLPTVATEKKVKKKAPSKPTTNDNAEVQARRAKKRAEARAKEEAARAAKEEMEAKQTEEMRRRREQRRREQMAAEEEEATKLVEEDEDEDEEDVEEEDDDGLEALDLDA